MEILLIGNGFDLEHKLPTSYKSFLEFCERVRRIYTLNERVSPQQYQRKNLDGWEMDDSIKAALLSAFKGRKCNLVFQEDRAHTLNVTTPNDLVNELYTHLNNNTWLDYFRNCPSYIGENWIDFEAEISRVIQALDAKRVQLKTGSAPAGIERVEQEWLMPIWRASRINAQSVFENVDTLDDFTCFLEGELTRLIRALEIYIAGFIHEIAVPQKNPDIEKLTPDRVLSFNYSDTYERVYGAAEKIRYDFIHGKADMSKHMETSDLVLGIDEYLDDTCKDEQLEFLPFKKYYQRIYKSTGNAYLDWVDEIKAGYAEYLRKVDLFYAGEPDPLQSIPGQRRYYMDLKSIHCPNHDLYIFGHSLDVTDKDVLKLLICNDNVYTKIFYHRRNKDDKTALGSLIKNLVRIIGQDELIRRTGGPHKTIEFIPQTLHTDER